MSTAGIFAALGPGFMANPYPFYKNLNATDPVLFMPDIFGVGGYFITSHAACSAVLRSKHFGKEAHRVLPPDKLALIPQERSDFIERRKSSMLFSDPPNHTRLRGLVNQAFTPRTIERLRPSIAAIAERLLDQVASRGRMDLIRDFAFPLPIIVIAELLGVPPEDRDQFKAWSTDLTAALNPTSGTEEFEKVKPVIEAFNAYISSVIDERRREPRADLISALIQAHDAGDKLNREELLTTCRLLLTAGHETTVNLIGNGMLALLRNPEVRAALAADPTRLAGAVEELLRYDSPVQMTMRFAMEDTDLNGRTLPKGSLVVTLLGAANRDPTHFSDPDRLDIGRENAHTHLAFGGGVHYCVGAALARLEGEIAIGALLRRLPRLALGAEEIEHRSHLVLRGLNALHVTF